MFHLLAQAATQPTTIIGGFDVSTLGLGTLAGIIAATVIVMNRLQAYLSPSPYLTPKTLPFISFGVSEVLALVSQYVFHLLYGNPLQIAVGLAMLILLGTGAHITGSTQTTSPGAPAAMTGDEKKTPAVAK